MRNKHRRSRVILLLFGPLALLLSACQTDLAFDVRANNTYTMTARMVMDEKAGDPNACAEMKNVLANAKDAASEIELKQSKEGDHTVCLLNFREPQPISITSEPFLVIRRNGDYFTAKLPADHTMSFAPNTQFHMTLTFPGNIKSVTGPVPGAVSGKSVTWTRADVLRAGFEVTARANTGMTRSQIALLVIAIILGLFGLLSVLAYALRETKVGRKVWDWERGWLIPVGKAVIDFFLAILDFGYRVWRALRRRWRHLRLRYTQRKQANARVDASSSTTQKAADSTSKSAATDTSLKPETSAESSRSAADTGTIATVSTATPVTSSEVAATQPAAKQDVPAAGNSLAEHSLSSAKQDEETRSSDHPAGNHTPPAASGRTQTTLAKAGGTARNLLIQARSWLHRQLPTTTPTPPAHPADSAAPTNPGATTPAPAPEVKAAQTPGAVETSTTATIAVAETLADALNREDANVGRNGSQTQTPAASTEEIVATETSALPLKLPVSTLGLYFAEPRAELSTPEIERTIAETEPEESVFLRVLRSSLAEKADSFDPELNDPWDPEHPQEQTDTATEND